MREGSKEVLERVSTKGSGKVLARFQEGLERKARHKVFGRLHIEEALMFFFSNIYYSSLLWISPELIAGTPSFFSFTNAVQCRTFHFYQCHVIWMVLGSNQIELRSLR